MRRATLVILLFTVFFLPQSKAEQSHPTGPVLLDPSAPLNVQDFGAKGNGITDDSAALQAAIDIARGRPILIPSGRYLLKKPLKYLTRGDAPGLKIQGQGMMVSILIPDFDNDSVFSIDGSGTANQFQYGGYIRELSIQSQPSRNHRNVTGISLTSNWYFSIEKVEIRNLSGDGIRIAEQEDISKNPDDYATIYLQILQSRIVFNQGWGIKMDARLGASATRITYSQIIQNRGGGIMGGGHQLYVGYNAIAANGEPASGGLLFDHTSANGLTIEHNEFESNYLFHIRILGAANGLIAYNRLNSSETQYKDGSLHPPVQIDMGADGKIVRNFSIIGNNHRSDTAGDLPLTLYRGISPRNITNLKIEGNRKAEITKQVKEEDGIKGSPKLQFLEGAR